jgi:hypothetical protein
MNLEQQEKAILRREEQMDRESSLYNDWLSDNIVSLRQDFLEEQSDQFNAFCKQAFKERE